jgi:hypothetical protein
MVKRQEEEKVLSLALEATRQRIIQYRIDNELPPLSPQKLDFEAAEAARDAELTRQLSTLRY